LQRQECLIRKPVEQVFEAFINPEITVNFWFSKSTGRLDENNEVLYWSKELNKIKFGCIPFSYGINASIWLVNNKKLKYLKAK
jgi:hypothetical protein